MEVMTLAHFQCSSYLPYPSCLQLISPSCVSCFSEWCQHLCSGPKWQLGRSQFPYLHNQLITKSCQFSRLGDPLVKLDTLLPQHCTTWCQGRACCLGLSSCVSVMLLPCSWCLALYVCVFPFLAAGLYANFSSSTFLDNSLELSIESSYRKPSLTILQSEWGVPSRGILTLLSGQTSAIVFIIKP